MHQLAVILSTILYLAFLTSAYTKLSDASLQSIPHPGKDFDIHSGDLLAPILKVRVPGTPGIVEVRRHFLDFFSRELPAWKITLQNSTQQTALGGAPIDFVNIIATRDPPWARSGDVGRLALVAHYDSKRTPKGFIGATDSAAPCAMLLHAARVVDKALTKKWEHMQATGETHGLDGEKGVQLILLDGEEAFIEWTDTDSIYGARALAQAWDSTYNVAMSTYQTPLQEISLFLLLDLLGSKNPSMPSYFKTTHWAYKHMGDLEARLRTQKLFKSSPANKAKSKSKKSPLRPTREPVWLHEMNKDPIRGNFMGGMIQDDHLPFMARGVEVLHLIPSPFPSVWHTSKDNGEHLDMDTTEDWAVLVSAFTAEWMDLEGFLEKPKLLNRDVDVDNNEQILGLDEEGILDRRKDERTEL